MCRYAPLSNLMANDEAVRLHAGSVAHIGPNRRSPQRLPTSGNVCGLACRSSVRLWAIRRSTLIVRASAYVAEHCYQDADRCPQQEEARYCQLSAIGAN